MTTIIKQRTPFDCGVCTIAMATGNTYEGVWDTLTADHRVTVRDKGMNDSLIKHVMQSLGFTYDVDYTKRTCSPHWGTLGFVQNNWWGRRVMLDLFSKNHWEGRHLVYFDGKNVCDPSTQQVYNTLQELDPLHYWIFNES